MRSLSRNFVGFVIESQLCFSQFLFLSSVLDPFFFLFLAVAISTKKQKRNRQNKREDRELKKEIGIERNIAATQLQTQQNSETKISFKIKQTLNNLKSMFDEENKTFKTSWYARNLPANYRPNDLMFQRKFAQECCLANPNIKVKHEALQRYRAKYIDQDGFLPRAFQKRMDNPSRIVCYTATTKKKFLQHNYEEKYINLHGFDFQLIAGCVLCCSNKKTLFVACANEHAFCQGCLDKHVDSYADR
jgi:hypothetical protein